MCMLLSFFGFLHAAWRLFVRMRQSCIVSREKYPKTGSYIILIYHIFCRLHIFFYKGAAGLFRLLLSACHGVGLTITETAGKAGDLFLFSERYGMNIDPAMGESSFYNYFTEFL